MRNSINTLWHKVSRIGLSVNEGVLDHREVIFVNRMLFLCLIVMLLYIPLELALNGPAMILVIIVFILLLTVPFLLNRFRLFAIARSYSFFLGCIFIFVAGLMAGKGVNNHVAFIPLVLLGVIMFKTNTGRIMVFLTIVTVYLIQRYYLEVVTPIIQLPDDLKEDFKAVFFLMSLLLCFLLGFYFVKINSEYEGLVIEQKIELADKNKEITDSIAYAKRIQKAILPPDRLVKENLPDSFILYKPKDIVAGDFYWMEEAGDLILFAAADCTGHGVPGAMVSVVCTNALNRCVREFNLSQPSEILNKTREIIIREFEKSEEEIKDGMDISLAALNFKTSELEWAGANNPLLMIRNNDLIEIKADKQPVGKFIEGRTFTNHTMKLEKGDLIYLFSDGYSDQFGGPSGKKLKYKAFKQLLLDHHMKPMHEQETLLACSLNEWKGRLEQVDDVCVIGVRI